MAWACSSSRRKGGGKSKLGESTGVSTLRVLSRDATFALWGLYALGFDHEANDFFHFIADAASEDRGLHPMYGVGGEHEIEESVLEHLVRVSRCSPRADRQRRICTGPARRVGLAAGLRVSPHEVPGPLTRVRLAAPQAGGRGRDRTLARTDHGIWEIRGEPQHFTSSKLMCWVAADRGARLAQLHDEPRIRATVLAISNELTQDGLVLRYRVEEMMRSCRGERRHSPSRRSGWCQLWPRSGRGSAPAAVRAAVVPCQPAGTLCGGARSGDEQTPRELPAGVHPPGADQRGDTRDPGRRTSRLVGQAEDSEVVDTNGMATRRG